MSKENFEEQIFNKEREENPEWFKKGYRILASWYHPDNKLTGDSEKMKLINIARDNQNKQELLKELKNLSTILGEKEKMERELLTKDFDAPHENVFNNNLEEKTDSEIEEFLTERFSGIVKKPKENDDGEYFDRYPSFPEQKETKKENIINLEESFDRPSTLPKIEEEKEDLFEESFDRPSTLPKIEEKD